MKHHYVPQFLLRAWAEATPDKKIETFRLDLKHVPSSRHAPEYTAYEKNLYALTLDVVAGMEQQAVETRLLRHIDTRASEVLRKLTNTGFAGLTMDDRMDWVRFLMSLRLRQPTIIQQLRTESSEYLERSLMETPKYENLAEVNDPPTMLDWTNKNYPGLIDNVGMSFFHGLVSNKEVGMKLLKMKWWLWDFQYAKSELLLSDHPCIFSKNIDDPDLIVALPIGPRKAFMATRSEQIASIMRKQRPNDLYR